ncbi:MAG: ABC transporter substrate-binding protein [Gammaproteobacteria bacterium]|nr:ABC transporter substrate-binding protein [Gammaproteobacteria bacterium]MBU0787016.1 ABC transporter substrate-binding protein [Gammaproteobacteria bacterium]MBU0816267.1 ABC transporter substrate-binding protein [Gammaproteobacteria bacterium]MBU1787904.1 ABC transporter substrate-binding protein [Gammaproteobacteria bacterium]
MFAAGLCPLLWALGGCAPSRPLVLAGHPWPGYEPMFLGHSMGLFPQGVNLLATDTVQSTIDSLRQGAADGAMLTLDEVLMLRAQNFPLEVVLVFDVSKGGDVLLARQDIQDPSALKGRRVGAEDSTLGILMLTMVLERAGLSMQDIHPVKVAYASHLSAWESGRLDALVTYEPVAGRLKKAGAHQLLSTRELPDTIIDVLAVMPQAAQTHASALRDALHAHFRALTYMRQNPWDSAYRIAPRLGISAEALVDSLRGLELPDLVGNQRYLSKIDGHLDSVARRVSPILEQAGLIKAPVNTERLYSSLYLPRGDA